MRALHGLRMASDRRGERARGLLHAEPSRLSQRRRHHRFRVSRSWSSFKPELVCIEGARKTEGYFESHGYRRIDEYLQFDRQDWYFTPKNRVIQT